MSDLYFENTAIWKCRGKPYKITILETHGTKPSKVMPDDKENDDDDNEKVKKLYLMKVKMGAQDGKKLDK
uniref:Uncharacterized protein n=1 Tax=Amphimedon queenslandica TaxID=400682 RepID=A0A1X7TKM9_AMPQE